MVIIQEVDMIDSLVFGNTALNRILAVPGLVVDGVVVASRTRLGLEMSLLAVHTQCLVFPADDACGSAISLEFLRAVVNLAGLGSEVASHFCCCCG